MRAMTVVLIAGLAAGSAASAQDKTGPKVTFGAFVDGYYAYDFGRPTGFDRAFTTQPARHNEFNVNLAHIEARLEGDNIRGRIALQAGTSVQSNYAAEPAIGAISGAGLSRHIQEAIVGVRVGTGVWIDGGIYLSHIGAESWVSRDNLTYTRSLIADYSPYYQAGVRLTWAASSRVTAQLNVVNGWQIISENNGGKSVGARIDWTVSPKAAFSVYNLVGNEIADGQPARARWFQGASLKLTPSGRTTLVGTFDVGYQEGASGSSGSTWYGTALIGRVQASSRLGVSARVERYSDPDQVIIATGQTAGFEAWGGSIGVDLATADRVLWRTELRGFSGSDRIFPDRGAIGGLAKGNGFIVSSLAVTF